MNQPKRILLTGHTGFIGRKVLPRLQKALSKNDTLYALGRRDVGKYKGTTKYLKADIRDRVALAGVLANCPPFTHVIHLAAVSTQDADPFETYETNLRGTLNLAALVSEYTRFVFASSAAVFGDKLEQAPSEEDGHAPTTVYGSSKSLAETTLRSINRRLVILRPVAQVGTGATHGLLKDVIKKLQSNDPVLELRGDCPGSAKPFLHVSDTAKSIVQIALGGACRPYHLSPSDCLTVDRVARIAMEEMNIHKQLCWLGSGSTYRGDQKVVRLTPSDSPYTQFCASEEAVRRAVRDYRK